jgi:NAD(P)-dependent dehydrogenase (short-subunit alcohol dehydrogenase family)
LGQLEGRLALITGASRGLGAALAERFAAEGARLILVARTVGGLEEVDDKVKAVGGEATLVPLDLLADGGIDQLGGAIAERFGKLDILVANAGELANLGPLGHIEPKAFEHMMALHATANYRLIRSLDPLLRRSAAGRAIFVTADVATSPRPFWGAYAASKAALEALVKSYAAEVEKTPLRVLLVDPGPMATRLRSRAYPGEAKGTAPAPAERVAAFVALASAADEAPAKVDRDGIIRLASNV